MLGLAVPAAQAGTPGYLSIHNNSDAVVSFTVTNAGWNCNDAPLRGDVVQVPAGGTVEMLFVRKNGHGCDGEQGVFDMLPSFTGYVAQPQSFSYDSHGSMALVSHPNYASTLTDDGLNGEGHHQYTWSVTPTQ